MGRLTGGGTDGNERLTALTAIPLLALLVLEGVTIVFPRPLLPVHLFVGLLLVPPVALKLGSTGYRFVRYYTRDARYRRKGPPPILLRATAPVVVATSVLVLASGVWLLLAGPTARDALLPVHKIGFIVWAAFTGLHILGHALALPPAVVAEYGPRRSGLRRLDGRAGRALAIAVSLAAGVALAMLLIPHFGPWQSSMAHHHHHHA
jgi:hypothetical protein